MSKEKKETVEVSPVIEEKTETVVKRNKPVNRQEFVARKLRALNEMANAAKARDIAKRVLNNN